MAVNDDGPVIEEGGGPDRMHGWVRVGINVPYSWLAHGVWFLVIHRRPSDFPGHYTMRVQGAMMKPKGVTAHGVFCGIYQSLEEARLDVPPHAHPMGRNPDDDPCIVEVWML